MERVEFPFIVLPEEVNKRLFLKEVIIFGAGKVGKSVSYILEKNRISVKAFLDNCPDKWEKKIFGHISCIKPELVKVNIPILIAVEDMIIKKEIGRQCSMLGYQCIYDIDTSLLINYIDDLSDEEYLELQYYLKIGKILDLKNPKTFNAKLQWLKLYDRKSQYMRMTDKYEVKKYVAGIIGKEYIIPTLGIWNSFDEIDFASLPKRFVLKCTHDSGSASIIFDKEKIEYEKLKEKYLKALNTNHYKIGREWVYKDIKPRIIGEKYIGEANGYEGDLVDYKLMCFNGKVRCSFTCTRRFTGGDNLKVTFYDTNWKKMPFERHYSSEVGEVPKPVCYDEMVEMAERLTKDIIFARIDFYEVDRHPYFGEITLYPGSGFEEFTPFEWDIKLGEWLKLPE